MKAIEDLNHKSTDELCELQNEIDQILETRKKEKEKEKEKVNKSELINKILNHFQWEEKYSKVDQFGRQICLKFVGNIHEVQVSVFILDVEISYSHIDLQEIDKSGFENLIDKSEAVSVYNNSEKYNATGIFCQECGSEMKSKEVMENVFTCDKC